MKASLYQGYRRRYDIIVLLLVNLGLLISSYAVPFMQAKRFFFFREEYTLLKSIDLMMEAGHYVLAFIVFFFSVVFPIGKLCLLLTLWFAPFRTDARIRALHWIASVGKWSMLDVFIVALLVVLISARGATNAEPLIGLYLFMSAILLSMVMTQWMQRLAHKQPAAHGMDVSV